MYPAAIIALAPASVVDARVRRRPRHVDPVVDDARRRVPERATEPLDDRVVEVQDSALDQVTRSGLAAGLLVARDRKNHCRVLGHRIGRLERSPRQRVRRDPPFESIVPRP